MKHKVLIIFLVACVVAVAECKKDIKCLGLACARRGNSDGREEDYEPCKEFCERREREKQLVKDEERACSSRKGRSRGKEWGQGRCRGRIFEHDRKGSKGNREESTREKDCACQEKKMVRGLVPLKVSVFYKIFLLRAQQLPVQLFRVQQQNQRPHLEPRRRQLHRAPLQ